MIICQIEIQQKQIPNTQDEIKNLGQYFFFLGKNLGGKSVLFNFRFQLMRLFVDIWVLFKMSKEGWSMAMLL